MPADDLDPRVERTAIEARSAGVPVPEKEERDA